MKTVLLIGYPFPLRPGGSPRLLGLAKYLPEFGWQPVILTAPLDEKADPRYRIIETDYRDALGFLGKMLKLNPEEDARKQVKRRLGITAKKSVMDFILTRAGEIINYPDSEKGWKPFAIKDGEELLQKEKIDAVISTSAPVTAHIIANRLKSRHNIPWVADLRDLWTQNHNYSYSPVRKLFDRRLELKTLAAADVLVTVSQPWANKLGTLHKGKAIYAITNGFDPETVNIPPANLTTKFTITYTGMIYPGKQNPSRLLAAMQGLISDGTVNPDDIEIRFYGSREDWLEKETEKHGLSGVTRQYGEVLRDIALQKQRESQVLLLLNWDDPQEKGNYPGKVFEYLAAGRPILATGGSEDDAVAGLLKETGGTQATTVEATMSALKGLYQEYLFNGSVSRRGGNASINKYSQREMAKRFSEVLDRLLKNPKIY
jgi:glycosyltransferase involved in cell wall biosynthesis